MRHRLSRLAAAGLMVAAAFPTGAAAAAENAVVPGELRVDPSFEAIGVVWFVDGDDNRDSTFAVDYRPVGSTTWQPAAPAVRADPATIVNGTALGIHSWGASAVFLTEGTVYELRATLVDPDGGSETRTVTVSTLIRPRPNPVNRYVVPGSGGGSGTAADPFRGLQAAADAARPGDTFSVAPGLYQPFQILTSGVAGAPIAFIGPGDGTAVVDGDGTDRGIVTIGEYDRVTSYVIVSGLTIRDGHWGIDAQHTQDIVIEGNEIVDVDDGITNRRGDDLERRQVVCDNVIAGRTPWPGTGIPSERGIDLRGWGNVVCHNRVSDFGDCVSVQPFTGPSYGNDVYGNDAYRCVDDGIEVDYNQANLRVWGNRVTNARMGVSVQPIRGGPAYIFRNTWFNLESNTIKLNNGPSGLYVTHNTGIMVGNGLSDGSVWNHATFRNNLFLGTRYAFEFTTTGTDRDLDYDAWGTSREIDPGGPWFKWDDVRYDRIADLPAGVEDQGVEVGFDDLVNASLPASWDVEVAPAGPDLRLVAGSVAVDAGIPVPNLDDPYPIVGLPDLGAYELGSAPPVYGPRGTVGARFVDVPGTHVFFADVEWLAAAGITKGCNPPANDRFCPDDPVTRGQMAAFVVRALSLPDGGPAGFGDTRGHTFEADIDRLAAAGITKGCNPPANDRFCPDDPVTRGQMAAFVVRALGLSDDGGGNRFVDDDGSVFEADIAKLAAAGITKGCNPPANDRFCPDDPVTRAQMAAFLHRALG